ncbi:hypothetical protein ASD64_14640 [Mesorhizobium sp. Root157]|uniref:hypothetical protein n=1 Tax=Mesorhizobium sp. Root157 TaxID=1736477 RepID=UPI0006F3E8AF|nr:hypothetical protein [Mesorhizobium sp. Root157]KQZ99566.1 hypothetical protein ASD64_14640 [Mesorhizobium sp. Root157]
MSEDPNKALREAVIAMASSRPRRRSNRNPIYKPDPAFREWASLTGYCDGILSLDFDLARDGPVDGAQQARDMISIRAAMKKLSEHF